MLLEDDIKQIRKIVKEEMKAKKKKNKHLPDSREIMKMFYLHNKVFNYKNNTFWTSCDTLVDKLGLDRVKQITQKAFDIQGKEMAPVIDNPLDLLNKFTKVENYKKEKSNFKEL